MDTSPRPEAARRRPRRKAFSQRHRTLPLHSPEPPVRRNPAECRAVDAALEGAKLDEAFTFSEEAISVRWMWQHMVEEYARHNGHAHLIREVIDGSADL